MSPDEIRQLRLAAEAASPGPWTLTATPAYDDGLLAIEIRARNHEPWQGVLQASGTEETFVTEADAAYLSQVGPDRILALLDALEASATQPRKQN